MATESLIQNQIRVGLSKAGYMVFRINVGKVRMAEGRRYDTGAPKGFWDLFGFRPVGLIFFIEVKNEKGRLREDQKKFMNAMKKRGALVGVARSVKEAMDIVNEKQS